MLHHPRYNMPYNVLCRMANPSRSNVIAEPISRPSPRECCIMRLYIPLRTADSSVVPRYFLSLKKVWSRFKWDDYNWFWCICVLPNQTALIKSRIPLRYFSLWSKSDRDLNGIIIIDFDVYLYCFYYIRECTFLRKSMILKIF